jgi:predicted NBD/HSP70 family sugar kinase
VGAAFTDPASRDWTALHRVVEGAADALGAGLASAVNLLDLRLVVVGGSIQRWAMPTWSGCTARWCGGRWSRARRAPGLFNAGRETALIGAAILARQGLARKGLER